MKKKLFDLNWKELIESATRDAVSELIPDEKAQQDKVASQMRNFRAPKKQKKNVDKNDDQATDEAEENSKEKGLKPLKAKKSELPEINLARIISKIDSIRAGKSLKNKDIKKELNDYYTRLNGNERIALYAFLSGLDKIMGGEFQGEELPTPKVDPYQIKMKKKSVDPKKEKPTGAEDSPIIVGESANKSRERLIVSRNVRKK